MDPSPAIIAQWNSSDQPATIRTVAEWAGFQGPLQVAVLSGLGAEPTEHYRALAALPTSDVDEIIEDLVVESEMGGVALTKFQAAKLRTFFRGARVAAGVQKSTDEERQADVKKLEREPAQPVTTAKTPGEGTDDVALNGTVYQSGSTVTKRLDETTIRKLYENYGRRRPRPIADPTVDQISAFYCVTMLMALINVDFAV